MKQIYGISVIIILSISLSSCWMYSFTGASIPPDAKTFSIGYFPNRATLIQPTLSQEFTEALKDRFISQTPLTSVSLNADMQFEGEITGYSTAPAAISGNEQATSNRLTITVKVRFTNLKEPTKNFDASFTRYADFDAQTSFETIEAELNKLIIAELVDDIFNKAFVNW